MDRGTWQATELHRVWCNWSNLAQHTHPSSEALKPTGSLSRKSQDTTFQRGEKYIALSSRYLLHSHSWRKTTKNMDNVFFPYIFFQHYLQQILSCGIWGYHNFAFQDNTHILDDFQIQCYTIYFQLLLLWLFFPCECWVVSIVLEPHLELEYGYFIF